MKSQAYLPSLAGAMMVTAKPVDSPDGELHRHDATALYVKS